MFRDKRVIRNRQIYYSNRRNQIKKPNVFERYGTYSERASVIVSFLGMIGTIAVLLIAVNQNKLAGDAIKEAKRANDIANENLQLAQRVFDSSTSAGQIVLELQKKSVEAQIASLREYKATNIPRLQVDSLNIISGLIIGEYIFYNIKIINTNSTDVEIVEEGFHSSFGTKPISDKQFYKEVTIVEKNIYANDKTPYRNNIQIDKPLSEEEYNAFIGNFVSLYIKGHMKYRNTVTNDTYIFKFQEKMDYRKKDDNIYSLPLPKETKNIKIEKKPN